MANFHRLIFLFFLSFFSFNSFAVETFPANRTYCAGPAFHDTTCGVANFSRFESLSSALDFMMPLCQAQVRPNGLTECRRDSDKISYLYSNNWSSRSPQLVYSCPANSYAWGTASVCACSDGFNLKNGQCVDPNYVEPPDPCEGLDQYCETLRNKADEWVVNNKKSPSLLCLKPSVFVPVIGGGASYWDDRFPGCSRGCLMLPGGFSVSYQDDEDKWVTSGTGTYQGSDCSPEDIQDTEDPENPEPQEPEMAKKPDPNCPIGHYSGTYNGTKVCLPPKSSSGVTFFPLNILGIMFFSMAIFGVTSL